MGHNEQRLFSRDFTLVVIGQIISLFGNAMIRFVLPLYLLNQTGSSALHGAVTACAFIPAVILSPIGGIIADRVNKRNIMVILDFLTAVIVWIFLAVMDRGNQVFLLTATLMLLYGIAGAYQPSVQASVPVLASQENFMAANAVINTVSSFAALLGPVLGGIFYSAYGLRPVLAVCAVCFVLSAFMELFIHIPFVRQPSGGGVIRLVRKDFRESVDFIRKEKPVLGRGLLAVCGINFFLSAMIMVGLPYMVTVVMGFSADWANRLYGFAEGALAAGGLAGGICAGVFAKRLPIQKAGYLLTACAVCVFPMGISLILCPFRLFNYGVMAVCCFLIMIFSTIFTVQIMSFVQAQTPENLIGKVIAVMMTVAMCAQPAGNAMYGVLFELAEGFEYGVILFSGVTSFLIAAGTRKILQNLSAAYTI